MINKFFVDNNYNIELLVNMASPWNGEQIWNNSIVVRVDADNTANQYLEVTGSALTATFAVTSGQVNEIDIPMTYWTEGGDMVIQPYKNGSAVSGRAITISFPDVINGSGMISKVEETIGYVYSMSGTQYAEDEVKEVKETVEQQTQEIDDLQRNKQNFIDEDLNAPSGTGEEGDLIFVGATGNSDKEVYRYENNAWVKVNLGTKVEANPSEDASVRLNKLQVDDTVYSIPQGEHIFSTEEHLVGKWTNENDVYERTYKLNSLPSNAAAQYQHDIGGIGLVIYTSGIVKEGNVYTDMSCNNEIKVDDTYITLTASKAQSGYGYLTIGYTKPVGGYYPNNQYYMKNTGFVCSGWYASASKTVVGDCYCGMIVGLNGTSLTWTTFCISLLQATVQGMAYRYELNQGSLTFNGQTWFYSYSQVEGSYASSTNLDNTQPPERRFYIGSYTGDFVTVALTQLLESIYT